MWTHWVIRNMLIIFFTGDSDDSNSIDGSPFSSAVQESRVMRYFIHWRAFSTARILKCLIYFFLNNRRKTTKSIYNGVKLHIMIFFFNFEWSICFELFIFQVLGQPSVTRISPIAINLDQQSLVVSSVCLVIFSQETFIFVYSSIIHI